MSIALHNPDSWRFKNQRLVWPFAISLILHLLVLTQLHWNGMHSRLIEPHRFTVNLVSTPQSQIFAAASNEQSMFPTTKALDAKDGDYQLDINRIREQVRIYAMQELATVKPLAPVAGEYFGIYSGGDSGIFSFRLDGKGHALGHGQSDSYGIAFLIEGDVLPNGDIRAVGARYVGESKFSGMLHGSLDRRTGKISGNWIVNQELKGSFSGQRETQFSMN